MKVMIYSVSMIEYFHFHGQDILVLSSQERDPSSVE